MSMDPAEPSPTSLSAGIDIHVTADNRAAWAIATDADYTHAHTADSSDANAAYLAAFEHLLATFPNSGIDLYCPDEQFLTAMAPYAAAWPQVTIHPWTEQRVHGVLVRSARRAAKLCLQPQNTSGEEADDSGSPAPLTRMVAATDGSTGARRTKQISGYGWITESGAHGHGTVPGPILVAELTAILRLIEAVAWNQPLEVLVDSRPALAVVRDIRAGHSPTSFTFPGAARQQDLLRRLARRLVDRDIVFTWVPSHSGVPLNEAADALAVQARRAVQWSIPERTHAATTRRIVADTMAAVRDGAAVGRSA